MENGISKKTNELELVGIGSVRVYSISAKTIEIPRTTKEGVKVKPIPQKRSGERKFIGEDKKEYSASEIGYIINNNFFTKIDKTKKVKNYKILPNEEVKDLLYDSYYVITPADETTRQKLVELGVYSGKSLVFAYKKSSVGSKFSKAVINSVGDVLFLNCSSKPVTKEEVAKTVETEILTKKQVSQLQKNEIVVKAEDIQIPI